MHFKIKNIGHPIAQFIPITPLPFNHLFAWNSLEISRPTSVGHLHSITITNSHLDGNSSSNILLPFVFFFLFSFTLQLNQTRALCVLMTINKPNWILNWKSFFFRASTSSVFFLLSLPIFSFYFLFSSDAFFVSSARRSQSVCLLLWYCQRVKIFSISVLCLHAENATLILELGIMQRNCCKFKFGEWGPMATFEMRTNAYEK